MIINFKKCIFQVVNLSYQFSHKLELNCKQNESWMS